MHLHKEDKEARSEDFHSPAPRNVPNNIRFPPFITPTTTHPLIRDIRLPPFLNLISTLDTGETVGKGTRYSPGQGRCPCVRNKEKRNVRKVSLSSEAAYFARRVGERGRRRWGGCPVSLEPRMPFAASHAYT